MSDFNPVFIQAILAPLIPPTISILYNNSLSEGIFPDCFKTAKIIQIFKSGNSNSTVNYRSISMLPFLSKIFQKLMCAIEQTLTRNRIIFYLQISLACVKIQMQLLNSLIMFIHRQAASRAPFLFVQISEKHSTQLIMTY